MKETEEANRLLNKQIIEEKEVNIIYDKNQYSIKIPKEFMETIESSGTNMKKIKFKFTLETPSINSKEKPTLKGELNYG